MPRNSERARELPPGRELDALFFETCWPDEHGCWLGAFLLPPVTTDATACEKWVMRWFDDNDLRFTLNYNHEKKFIVTMRRQFHAGWFAFVTQTGTTLWHALVLAAIAAAETMHKEKRDG